MLAILGNYTRNTLSQVGNRLLCGIPTTVQVITISTKLIKVNSKPKGLKTKRNRYEKLQHLEPYLSFSLSKTRKM